MVSRSLPAVLLLLLICGNAAAAPAYVDRHEGPTNGWSLVPNRFGVRVVDHQRVQRDSASGPVGAEFVELAGPPGYSAMLLKPIGAAPVLEDLIVHLRLQTNRPGVLPAVRVVFPRVKDSGTGRPLAAIVRGATGAVGEGHWEDFRLDNLVKLVRRHARVLSGSLGRQVDDREAYVDAVVLILPSGPQGTRVWVDELAIHGVVNAAPNSVAKGDKPADATPVSQVQLTPSGLTIDGKAFFPRVVTHNGEPLGELRKVGFNVVALRAPPTDKQLEEAAKLKMKIICPPPALDKLASPEECRGWNPVVLWRLPGRHDARSLDTATAQVESLRRADRVLNRPILAAPTQAWAPWSRLVDGLLVYPPWSSAAAGQSGFEGQLAEVARFAQPGTPLLAVVPTTHSQSFMRQLAAFAPAGTVTPWRSPGRIISEVDSAALAGSLGVWADGDAPLTTGAGQRTRLALALVNLRLTLLEPWLRDGACGGELPSAGGAAAVTFSKGRTTLIIPKQRAGARGTGPQSYLTPGVAESVKAYELSPVGVRPVTLTRITGGAQATVSMPDAMLLLTDDNRAVEEVRRRQRAVTQRGLALEQALAIAELRHAESHLSPLALASRSASPDAAALNDARRWISHSKSAQSTGDLAAAYRHAVTARNRLEQWTTRRLINANPAGVLDSSPLSGQAATIIDHARLLQLIEPLSRGPNLLPGGDFENQASAAASGWRHIAREAAGAPALVEFSGTQPVSGQRALRIECPASDSPQRASVRIHSPEVNLKAGQLVEITGRVRVERITSGGALAISDSIGGDELSLHVDRPIAWRAFRMLRRSEIAGPMTVSFSAQGPITVSLDSVMIRAIQLPSAAKAAVLGVPALQRK